MTQVTGADLEAMDDHARSVLKEGDVEFADGRTHRGPHPCSRCGELIQEGELAFDYSRREEVYFTYHARCIGAEFETHLKALLVSARGRLRADG